MLLTLLSDSVRAEISSKEGHNLLSSGGDFIYRKSFRHREPILSSPDCLWRIEAGYVRTLTWDAAGTITALGVWGVGDIVGYGLSKIEPYQIECLTPVQVRKVSLPLDCFDTILSHMQQMEALLSISSTKQVSTRLIRVLEWLAQRFGKISQQGCVIDLPLTHQSLSELIGSTRVTVTRILNDLERAGRIKQLRQHRILLQDFEV
jgi:CRP-like cAMP-binding protein